MFYEAVSHFAEDKKAAMLARLLPIDLLKRPGRVPPLGTGESRGQSFA